tara:strand:+ start:766 stop:951 length:186 start_codon:yes stop_codon:yes gene_type:complete
MNTKEFIDYLETQMNYYKSFDRDMYLHYKLKLENELTEEPECEFPEDEKEIDSICIDYLTN